MIAPTLRRCAVLLSLAGPFFTGALASELIELRIGMGLPKPPYITKDGDGGLDCEIAEKVLARAGYKMIPLQYPQARALGMMRANQLDGALSITDNIGGSGYVSAPYVTYRNVAISLAKNKFKINRVADLANHSLASFQNARLLMGAEFSAVVAGHGAYREYAEQIIQNRLLYAGRVDVIVGDRYIFSHFNNDLGTELDARQAITIHEIFPPSPRQAVFRDRTVRDRFNAALIWMKQSGAIAALHKKYQLPSPD